MKSLFIAAAACGALISLAFAQETPEALGEAFCAGVVAEDAEALAALYTEDAVSYGPDGSVATGREAIAASWKPFFDGYDGFACSLDRQGGKDNGENHTAWGLWTMSATPAKGGDMMLWNGRYMDLSVKTPDGWRYVADHASMSAPASE